MIGLVGYMRGVGCWQEAVIGVFVFDVAVLLNLYRSRDRLRVHSVSAAYWKLASTTSTPAHAHVDVVRRTQIYKRVVKQELGVHPNPFNVVVLALALWLALYVVPTNRFLQEVLHSRCCLDDDILPGLYVHTSSNLLFLDNHRHRVAFSEFRMALAMCMCSRLIYN